MPKHSLWLELEYGSPKGLSYSIRNDQSYRFWRQMGHTSSFLINFLIIPKAITERPVSPFRVSIINYPTMWRHIQSDRSHQSYLLQALGKEQLEITLVSLTLLVKLLLRIGSYNLGAGKSKIFRAGQHSRQTRIDVVQAEFFLPWEISILSLEPLTDWMKSTHIINGDLLYLKSTVCICWSHQHNTFTETSS